MRGERYIVVMTDEEGDYLSVKVCKKMKQATDQAMKWYYRSKSDKESITIYQASKLVTTKGGGFSDD